MIFLDLPSMFAMEYALHKLRSNKDNSTPELRRNVKSSVVTKVALGVCLLTLSACAENITDVPAPESTLAKNGGIMALAGHVRIYTPDQNTENPILPPQLKVNIQGDVSGQNLKLKKYPKLYTPLSSSIEVISIGCGLKSDIKEMPRELKVDTLILCGNLNYKGIGLEYIANHIILKSLNLNVVSEEDLTDKTHSDFFPPHFYFETQRLTLMDDNHIQLEGYPFSDGRSFPHGATLKIYSFEDVGILKITSLPALKKYKQ